MAFVRYLIDHELTLPHIKVNGSCTTVLCLPAILLSQGLMTRCVLDSYIETVTVSNRFTGWPMPRLARRHSVLDHKGTERGYAPATSVIRILSVLGATSDIKNAVLVYCKASSPAQSYIDQVSHDRVQPLQDVRFIPSQDPMYQAGIGHRLKM